MKNQSVYNKLAKFSEHQSEPMKVELSLVSDIRKDMEATSSGTMQALNLISQAEVRLQKSLQDHKRILSDIQKGLASAKDLGADAFVKDLEKLSSYAKENIKFVQDTMKKLDSIG